MWLYQRYGGSLRRQLNTFWYERLNNGSLRVYFGGTSPVVEIATITGNSDLHGMISAYWKGGNGIGTNILGPNRTIYFLDKSGAIDGTITAGARQGDSDSRGFGAYHSDRNNDTALSLHAASGLIDSATSNLGDNSLFILPGVAVNRGISSGATQVNTNFTGIHDTSQTEKRMLLRVEESDSGGFIRSFFQYYDTTGLALDLDETNANFGIPSDSLLFRLYADAYSLVPAFSPANLGLSITYAHPLIYINPPTEDIVTGNKIQTTVYVNEVDLTAETITFVRTETVEAYYPSTLAAASNVTRSRWVYTPST